MNRQPCLKADRTMNKEEIETQETKNGKRRKASENKCIEQEMWDFEQEQEYL